MNRFFTILAIIGLAITCGLIVAGILLHAFMQTGTLVHLKDFGPVGLILFRDGIYITHHGNRVFHFELYYPATLIGALPMVYLIVDASRRRQQKRRGFSVLTPGAGQAK